MALKNIINTSTFSYSGYDSPSTTAGTDGNYDTYSGYDFRERTNGSYFYNWGYSYWYWNWASGVNIDQIKWKLYCYALCQAGASENSSGYGIYVTVTHSGGTAVLVSESGSGAGNWSGGYSQNGNIITDNTGWTGVTQIMVELYGKAKRVDDGAGGGDEYLYHYVYEVEANQEESSNALFFGTNV